MPQEANSFYERLAKMFLHSPITPEDREFDEPFYKDWQTTDTPQQQTPPQTRTQKEMQHINPNAMYYEGQFYILSGIEPTFALEMLGAFIIAFIYPPYGITIICLYALMHYINKEVKVKIQTDDGLVPTTIKAQKPQDLHINKLKALLLTLTTLIPLIYYYTDWLK